MRSASIWSGWSRSRRNTNLTGALLVRANLTDAVRLSQEQIDAALGDEGTSLPTLLHRPDAWLGGETPQP